MKPKQIKALELLIKGEYESLEEVAEELKISPRTLYNWRCDEEFNAEFERRLKIKIGGIVPRALKRQEELLHAHSEMVSHLAAKDILDRGGLNAENVVKLSAEEKIVIVDDIPEAADESAS